MWVDPRRFFYDLQEWEWIERRFDPRRAFAMPRSIAALIGPDPRVIADEVWAKLMWAGLNLTAGGSPDARQPGRDGTPWYPLELVRAVAMLWLFAGLRTDEILRLPCRRDPLANQQPIDNGEAERVCLLDVPVNKTTTAFTKPVDLLVGEAIEAWEADRPAQPKFTDRKTGELVDMLFAYRGAPARPQLHQPRARPAAVPQGRRSSRGRPRRDHRPPRAGDDRDPALQREGPDVAVRAAGLARAHVTAAPHSTTRGSPRSP